MREKRRAERVANYEKFMDSLVLSRNFQFNPQSMQRQPAGPLRSTKSRKERREGRLGRKTGAAICPEPGEQGSACFFR